MSSVQLSPPDFLCFPPDTEFDDETVNQKLCPACRWPIGAHLITSHGLFSPRVRRVVLDFGCGSNKWENTEKVSGAIGIDLDPGKADILGDIENLRGIVPSSQTDEVRLRHVIEHVNVKTTLSEAYRVLKPGGIIYLETPNALYLSQLVKIFFQGDAPVFLEHVQTFRAAELANALKVAGFQEIEVWTTNEPKRLRVSSMKRWERALTWASERGYLKNFRGNLAARAVK